MRYQLVVAKYKLPSEWNIFSQTDVSLDISELVISFRLCKRLLFIKILRIVRVFDVCWEFFEMLRFSM